MSKEERRQSRTAKNKARGRKFRTEDHGGARCLKGRWVERPKYSVNQGCWQYSEK
jgi:hypothetical protein